MKNKILNISLFILLFTPTLAIAQVPQAFSFMGVATDNNGKGIANTTINVEIKIFQGSAFGVTQYSETQSALTNENGLYNLSIGLGQVTFGSFKDINWSNLPMFISLSIDAKGGTDYVLAGTTQLLSVPYALKAGEATIKPKIAVSKNPATLPTKMISGSEVGGAFNYLYQWIDGTPQDVYVEYKGLPDNLGLRTVSVSGYSFLTPILNYTNVDTIINGVFTRSSQLLKIDKSVPIPSGTYPMELIFRTKDEILATLPYDLFIINNNYENCFTSLPNVKSLKSNDCSEFNANIESTVTFNSNTIDEATYTDIFNPSTINTLRFSSTSDCLGTSLGLGEVIAGDWRINSRINRFHDQIFENNFRATNQLTGETKQCFVVYE